MANDPHWNSVVLAMRMDDAGLTDMKGHAVTLNGGVTYSSVRSAYGGYSAKFDGTDDVVSLADSADFDFGGGDFTLECFVYRNTAAGGMLFSKVGSFPTSQFSFIFGFGAAGAIYFYVSTTGASTSVFKFSADGVLPTGVMTHVALVRSGTNIHICVNGVPVASETFSGVIYKSTAALKIGAYNTTPTGFANAYIDEVRITKGVARYPGAIPAESLPNTPPQLSGTVKDLAGSLVSRTVRSHRRSDGTIGGSTVSSASDGSFSLNAYDASSHYVVCFDDDLDENAIILDNITPIV